MSEVRETWHRNYPRYGGLIAYLIVMAGVIAAIWMVQAEERRAVQEDKAARYELSLTNIKQARQIDKLERITSCLQDTVEVQDEIITVLLQAQTNSPSTFEGTKIPDKADTGKRDEIAEVRANKRLSSCKSLHQ